MKAPTLLLLFITTLGLVACSTAPAATPSANPPQAAPSVAAPAAEKIVPTVTETDPVATQITTQCDQVIDPHVMTDSFPSTFEDLSVTGDIIADKGENTAGDGHTEKYSAALKTLTKNDEYYLTFSGADACGLNIGKGTYNQLVVGTNEYGWVKKVTVKGYSGLLVYDNQRSSYALDVLLKERLLVEVTADGPLGEEGIMRAAQVVDYSKIDKAIP